MARKRIGELLLERGAITAAQLEAALQAQQQTQQRLGAALVSLGAITEKTLAHALSEALGVPVIDLGTRPPDWSAIHLLRSRFCEQHDLFPVRPGERGRAPDAGGGHGRPARHRRRPGDGVHHRAEGEPARGARCPPCAPPSSATTTGPRPGRRRPPRQAPEALPVRPGGRRRGDHRRRGAAPRGDDAPRLPRGAHPGARGAAAAQARPGDGPPGRSPPGTSAPSWTRSSAHRRATEPVDRVEELERKFWALMRIMARKGLLTNEEFTRELDDESES